ncbi:1-phosphofructokinase [Oceanobacillus bengalensis]|uniref:Tagatose-6-phosphate kinase n=1 Tax=Oceanobacillus bengalensis TaxID=1435466 RepID=A0A494YZB2_9BACI|nr:1-phosphofructokinase [Oceanobacillus bengalensis]RKQ15557.1 1-phosphofructokinase [Oceanobacillus bengalensis]
MIYTVTLNPSIDYVVQVEEVTLGKLNKIHTDFKLPGGKGINVSRILHALETESTALGFLGGFTGEFIANWLKNECIDTDFIQVQDDTRINIKLKSIEETEINGRGPTITNEEADRLLRKLSELKEDDVVILSGSKPPSLPEDFYQQLIKRISGSNATFVIDTTGKDLETALSYKPLLIKPNTVELSDLFNVDLKKQEEIIPYGKKLLELGAEHVIVSMAGDGALLFTSEGVFRGISPSGTVKNSVGAGDSMIAGFIGEFMKSKNAVKAFKMGLAAGSATAFSDDLAKKEDILSILAAVQVEEF